MTRREPTGVPEPHDRAVPHAGRFLRGLDDRPVGGSASPEELGARLASPLPTEGVDAAAVVRELVETADAALVASTGGRAS